MPPSIDYMPVTFRHRVGTWQAWASFAAFAACLAAMGRAYDGHWDGLATRVGIFAFVMTAAAALWTCWGGKASEVRVEGVTLAFRDAADADFTVLPLADVYRIVFVDACDVGSDSCEIVVARRGRTRVDAPALLRLLGRTRPRRGPAARFRAAVLAVNENVRFESRMAQRCHECGHDLRLDKGRCAECGARVPVVGRFV